LLACDSDNFIQEKSKMAKLRPKVNSHPRFVTFFVAVFIFIAASDHVTFGSVGQTDGPLVGAVTEHSAKVFVRTRNSADVAVEYSTNESLLVSAQTAAIRTSIEADWTSMVLLDGLEPETTYFYTVLVNGVRQQRAPYPSFTTFPVPGSLADFSFAVLTDLASTAICPTCPAPVYAQVLKRMPSFVLQIGDFDHRNPQALKEMRKMHREVRGGGTKSVAGRDFARYLAPRLPLFHVWDDHDYGADNGNKTFFARAAAIRAFKEYYPTPDLANPTAGIWHKFSYGQADFFMLDDRSQRDPDSDPDGPDKSLLDGDKIPDGQKDWLKNSLLNSTALWKFVVSGVCFNPTCKPGEGWGAFNSEREELLDFIKQNGIQGVIVISGDLHSGGGIDDGTNAGVPEITVPPTNLKVGPPDPWGYGAKGWRGACARTDMLW
jgi:alkaline phosphatase D